jgi:hypothetical protein
MKHLCFFCGTPAFFRNQFTQKLSCAFPNTTSKLLISTRNKSENPGSFDSKPLVTLQDYIQRYGESKGNAIYSSKKAREMRGKESQGTWLPRKKLSRSEMHEIREMYNQVKISFLMSFLIDYPRIQRLTMQNCSRKCLV